MGKGGSKMSDIFFQNARGERLVLDRSMTIEDFVRRGITSINLCRQEEAAGLGWFFEVSGKSPKTDATRNVAKHK